MLRVTRRIQGGMLGCLFASCLLGMLGSGCYSPGTSRVINEPAPVGEIVRTNFGRMALLPDPLASGVLMRYPRSTSEAVLGDLKGAGAGGGAMVMAGTLPMTGYGAGFVGGLMVVGVVHGLFTGVPQSQIEADAKQLRQALDEKPLLPGVVEHVQSGLRAFGREPLVPVPPELAESLLAQAPAVRDYRPLAALGCDSVMELVVYRQAFRAERKGNPPMSFETSIHVYVTRISDGALLFVQPFDYRTRKYLFTQWAGEKARRFRSELDGLRRDAAQAILEQMFITDKP